MACLLIDEIASTASDARHVEDCPACGGLVTDDDIVIVDEDVGRTAWLACPHCGHEETKFFAWRIKAAEEPLVEVARCA